MGERRRNPPAPKFPSSSETYQVNVLPIEHTMRTSGPPDQGKISKDKKSPDWNRETKVMPMQVAGVKQPPDG